MKFDKLEEGMVLYSLTTTRMGNTTIRTKSVHRVRVISIDREKRQAMCSWNCNPPRRYFEREIEKLKAVEPILISTAMGGKRLPTLKERQEIMAARKANKEQA